MIKKYVAMVLIGSLVFGMTACKKSETPNNEAMVTTAETTVETIQTEETQAQAQTEETVAEQQAQTQASTTTKAQAQAKATGTTKAQTQAKASGTQAKATQAQAKAQAVAVATTTTKAKVAKKVPIYGKKSGGYICNSCGAKGTSSAEMREHARNANCGGGYHTAPPETYIIRYDTIYE